MGFFDRHLETHRRPLLLDGAVGTELISRGLAVRAECAEAWNVDRPGDVQAIHAAYAAAGSDAVQTNSFGLSRPRLQRFGRKAEDVRPLGLAAARLARAGAPGALIIGSLGPSGETLPLGSDADLGWVAECFGEAAAALADGGVDAIHLETMFHPGELVAASRGIRAAAPSLPLAISVTVIPGVSGLETPHGVPWARMLRALEAASPDACGVNCSLDAERMLRPIELLRDALALPILAKPQAKIGDKCASEKSRETPEAFVRHALALVDAGVCAIGGCCGVGPSAIAALSRALRARSGVSEIARSGVAEIASAPPAPTKPTRAKADA